MKRISYLFSLLLLMSFVTFTSCKDDEGTDTGNPTQDRLNLLAGTHTVQSATYPGGSLDITGQTITLTFTNTGAYTGSNTSVLPGGEFPQSGTLTFPNANNVNAARIGSTNINLISPTANGMSFTYQATDPKINNGDPFTVTVTTKK